MIEGSAVQGASRNAPIPPPHTPIPIAGLTPLTTTDYPGKLAAVLFLQGCAWRCDYCHNPGLIPRTANDILHWEDILAFLHKRHGLLDGVVFSGGEPTLHSGLIEAAREVRKLGFQTGLHTAGIYPDRLQAALPQFDWVGLDIKAPFDLYDAITAAPGSGERARASLLALLDSPATHEIRTTVHPDQLDEATLIRLGQTLAELGVKHYAVQAFRPQGCTSERLLRPINPPHHWDRIRAALAPLFLTLTLRGI